MSGNRQPDPRERDPLSEEQSLARDAARALPTPSADEEFRARMRAAFVAGFPEVEADAAPERPVRSARRWAPRRSWWAAAAVAACLVIAVGIANRGAAWRVVAVGANESVHVDGNEVSCEDLATLQAALRPQSTIAVPPGGRVELTSPGNFAFELGGGVEVSLPRAPGRWFGRDVSSQLHGDGTFRVVTGPRFAGARYEIRTSSMDIVVTGTAFTVMHSEASVCLCVLEGEITVTLPDGAQEQVEGGRRVFVAPEQGVVDHGPMHESEREALTALRARMVGATP